MGAKPWIIGLVLIVVMGSIAGATASAIAQTLSVVVDVIEVDDLKPIRNPDKDTYYQANQVASDDAESGAQVQITERAYSEEVIVDKTLTPVYMDNTMALPDLTLSAGDITFSDSNPSEGDTITINATVHNLDKDTYYWEIQAAIDDADSGNRIFVSAGIYYENVVISKTLTLMGEDRETTIIDGGGSGDVVYIYADWVNVSGFTVRNGGNLEGDAGIDVFSNNNRITDCVCYNNYITAVRLFSASNNRVGDCSLYSNNWGGIALIHYSSLNIIENCTFANNYRGIYFDVEASDNIVTYCKFSANNFAVESYGSSNTIINCDASSNNYSYYFHRSHDNQMINCTILDSIRGISSFLSANIIISNCNISNNHYGIYFKYSSYNTIVNNQIWGSKRMGLYVKGNLKRNYNHTIDTSNSINGMPLYYFFDIKNQTIEGLKTCHITIAWSENITVRNCDVTNGDTLYLPFTIRSTMKNCNILSNWRGIYLFNSSNNAITNCQISNNRGFGIYGIWSAGNTVTNCIISSNEEGMKLCYISNNNTITNCTVIDNYYYGIYLPYTTDNIIIGCYVSQNRMGIPLFNSINITIRDCNISNNQYGIYVYSPADNNSIYHNNFINNTVNAHDNCTNVWDNGYPSGGNYWDDYTGVDVYHGVNQDILGCDGIGDTPYNISGGSNQDRYPLMNPVGATDTTAPITTISVGEPKYWDGTKWYATTLTEFTLSATDDDSGVAYTYYRIWNETSGWTDWLAYTGAFTLLDECIYYLQYYSVDRAGNIETVHNHTYSVDDTPPSTNATLSGTPGDNDWHISDVTVTLSSTDAKCGVNYTMYSIDGAVCATYTGTITISSEGAHTVEYYAVDNLGNIEPVGSASFKIDKTNPHTACALSPAAPDGTNDWFVSAVTVTLTPIDNASGVAYTEYRIDSGTWTSYTAPFTVSTDGTHTIEYNATDNAGNTEEIKNFTIKLDTTAPAVALASPCNGTLITTSSVTLDCATVENTSGVALYMFEVDDNPDFGSAEHWANATINTQTLDLSDGIWYWRARARDNAGNIGSWSDVWWFNVSIEYAVDYIQIRTAPNGTGSVVGDVEYYVGENDTYWCAGYNYTMGYIGDYNASWTSNDTSIGIVAAHGDPTRFEALGAGICHITAEYNYVINATGTITVIAKNLPPKADFTFTPTSPTTADTMQFTDISSDSDGTIIAWVWQFGDGVTSTSQNPTHQYSDDGIYYVNLTVWDNDDAFDSFSRSVVVSNVAPIADFIYYQGIEAVDGGQVNVTIRVAGTKYKMVNMTITEDNVSISFVSVTRVPGEPNNATLSVCINASKAYAIVLDYTAAEKGSNPAWVTIQYDGISDTVHLVFNAQKNATQTKILDLIETLECMVHDAKLIKFDASSSYDPDGTILSWHWEFGDGDTATGSCALHKYDSDGIYQVTLTVNDDDGAYATTQKIISVYDITVSTDQPSYSSIGTIRISGSLTLNTGVNGVNVIVKLSSYGSCSSQTIFVDCSITDECGVYIQIKNEAGKVIYTTAASGNLPGGYTFNLTSSWYIPFDFKPGNYIIESFAWNHWVYQGPGTWEQLARKKTLNVTVVAGRGTAVMNEDMSLPSMEVLSLQITSTKNLVACDSAKILQELLRHCISSPGHPHVLAAQCRNQKRYGR